jgi:hypothetical protein
MTRGLHADTKVQRGDTSAVSDDVLRRGYEPKDAPAKGVALGTAAFFALAVLGLIVAAPIVWALEQALPPATAPRSAPEPPAPRLLTKPLIERQSIEAAQHMRLERGPVTIEEAMRRVAAEGWGDTAPAPPTAEAARNHFEAVK